jgi:hypothetical protein
VLADDAAADLRDERLPRVGELREQVEVARVVGARRGLRLQRLLGLGSPES